MSLIASPPAAICGGCGGGNQIADDAETAGLAPVSKAIPAPLAWLHSIIPYIRPCPNTLPPLTTQQAVAETPAPSHCIL